jgi:hypothetical protein
MSAQKSMQFYHSIKALSASGVETLANDCAWRFWQESPWNPNLVPKHANVFDVGSAAHLAVLEPEQYDARVVEVHHPDYKTKAAQELRDGAYEAGKVPILDKEKPVIVKIAEAIFERAGSYFTGGEAEVSLTWDWDGVPCKARPDYLIRERGLIVDLKTTTTCNPQAIARKAWNEGWASRVVWYKEAAMAIPGARPGWSGLGRGPRYIFVVIEVKPPHLIQLFELDERAEAWGQQIVRRGLRLFRECMAKGEWPAYGDGVQKLSLPAWSEYQLADREQAGEFSTRPTKEQIARSTEWLEP